MFLLLTFCLVVNFTHCLTKISYQKQFGRASATFPNMPFVLKWHVILNNFEIYKPFF